MKTLLLLPFLMQEPEITVLSKPWVTVDGLNQNTFTKNSEDFCDDLKYNYLNEKTELQNFMSRQNFLKAELKKIYSNKPSELTEEQVLSELQEMNKNVKLTVQKLNYLADEKFTSAKYQLGVHWHLPVFPRHREDEYERIVGLISTDGFRALNAFELKIYRAGRPFTKREYNVNYFYYAGDESQNLHHDFYVNKDNLKALFGFINNKEQHTFSIQKQASKLEICQIIPSLEIGLEIEETVKHEWMPAFTGVKQLYLKFEESL